MHRTGGGARGRPGSGGRRGAERGRLDNPQFRDALAQKSGDWGYPKDPKRYGYNAADLREFRVAADHQGLHFLIALQTMKQKDAAIAGIAIDTDGNPNTGSGQWPGRAHLTTQGADRFITTWGTGARITGGPSAHPLPHAVNLARNAIEVDVPWRYLGGVSPGAKVWVATGLATGLSHQIHHWMDPVRLAPAAYDTAQGPETYDALSQWDDKTQAAVLATGDITPFALDLHPNELLAGATHPFHLVPGFYNRIFRSRYTYGEGIRLKEPIPPGSGQQVSGTAPAMFRGRYQPYGLYVPQGYKPHGKPSQLFLDGHSLDVNQNEYAAVGTNQLTQLGDDRNSLIVTPLARGTDTWYLTTGLADTLEAWRDARRHYNTSASHTDIGGYSMGGYMTYRLGLLMPDHFARASVYVGPPLYYQWAYPAAPETTPHWAVRGNNSLLVDNGLDLPYEINDGDLDELVPISGVLRMVSLIGAAGDPYRFYDHAGDDHLSFIAIANQWKNTESWLGHHRIDRSPVRVRYVSYPSMDLHRYHLRFDGAYWVDGMQVRQSNPPSPGDHGEVDATTFALGGHLPSLVTEPPTVSSGESGISPATVTGQHYTNGARIHRRNAFQAQLQNLSAIRFDTSLMGLHPGEPVHATLTGEGGHVVLHFTGHWPHSIHASLDGSPVAISHAGAGIAIHADLDPSGPNHLLIQP